MIVTVTVAGRGRGARREKYTYVETYFEPRDFPQAIFVGEEVITGPFCKNCGASELFHGKDKRRRPDTCPPPPPLSKRIMLDTRPNATMGRRLR